MKRSPSSRDHAGAAAVLEHELRHDPVAQDRRAVVLEEADERLRERARAAARDRPAAALAAEDDRVGERPRAGGVERHERLERLPAHERPDVAALELVPDHVPGADRVAPQPDPPTRMLEQHLLERRAEAGRRQASAAEDLLDLVVLGDHAPVGGRVGGREALDLLAGAVEVHPHRELLAVGEDDVRDRIRLEVLEPVVRDQPELVLQEQRVDADQRVAGGARVDPIAGAEQLLRRGAAARDRRARRARGTRSPRAPGRPP